MATTFKAVVLEHHKKQDNTYNVKIRITHNRKIRYISTNIFVGKEDLTRGLKIKSQNILDNTKAVIDNYLSITSTHLVALQETAKKTRKHRSLFRMRVFQPTAFPIVCLYKQPELRG